MVVIVDVVCDCFLLLDVVVVVVVVVVFVVFVVFGVFGVPCMLVVVVFNVVVCRCC